MATPVLTMVDAIRQAMEQEMQRDKNVVIIGEDVGYDGGVFRATKGLIEKFGKERVMDAPLAESAIVGTSIGMAVSGLKPIAEIQFSGFIYPAFEQIVSHATRMRTRTRGKFSCPMVIRAPTAGRVHAFEHHSESMEAIYAHIQGLKVVIPSTPHDAKGLLIAAIRDPDPVLFLEPIKLYYGAKGEVPEEPYTILIGKANIVKKGSDLTLISWGVMMPVCRDAAEQAKSLGVDIELIDLRTISPLDSKTLVESAKKTGRVIIVHEGPKNCGVGAEISAQITEKALLSLKAPVKRVTGFDVIYPLYKLENYYGPQLPQIMKAIEEVVHF